MGCVSAIDSNGRTIWIIDAHRDEKRFVVPADEKLTALTFLSAYTMEVVSLALLILSVGVGLKRIESLVQISRLNGQLVDAIEKRGAVMAEKPNSEGLIVVKYPGRLLTMEAAANWVRELNDKIKVLHHLIEKETTRAETLYKWRNRLLLIGFCGLVLSKVLTPYLNSY